MSTPNGDVNLPQHGINNFSTGSVKRKRSNSVDQDSSLLRNPLGKHLAPFAQRLRNALPLLRKADQAPSLLDHPFSSDIEPIPKRAKHNSNIAELQTISHRIESYYYSTPDALLNDVDIAASSLTQDLEADRGHSDAGPTSKAVNQVNLFKQSLRKVCRHIAASEPRSDATVSQATEAVPKGRDDTQRPAVLTLTSQSERGPRPLYSGLQQTLSQESDDTSGLNGTIAGQKQVIDVESLPNGINAMTIAPSSVFDQVGRTKQRRTIGEAFAPNRALKPLEHPRPSKSVARGLALDWVNDNETIRSERSNPIHKPDHRYTSLPTGIWLQYGKADASSGRLADSTRKQLDRASALSENRPDASTGAGDPRNSKVDDLFRSVYSSFAPAYDNSAAVVPESTRNRAWWRRVGQRRFDAFYSIQYPELELDARRSSLAESAEFPSAEQIDPLLVKQPDLSPAEQVSPSEEDKYDTMVSTFQEADQSVSSDLSQPDSEAKEANELLREVSDLLQTLVSYQRIRDLSKTSINLATPTDAEHDTYELLRTQLAVIVQSLPPYAVAKLGGDQLELLNVSTNFIVGTKDHVGTVEAVDSALQRPRGSMTSTSSSNMRVGHSTGTNVRPGSERATPMTHGSRVTPSTTARTGNGNQPRSALSYGHGVMSSKAAHSPGRLGVMAPPRSGPSKPQQYPRQRTSTGGNVSPLPRTSAQLPNGYGPPYNNPSPFPHLSAHIRPRGTPAATPISGGSSTPRIVQKSQSSALADVREYAQNISQPSPTMAQGSPSNPYTSLNPVTMTEQAKAQLQAHRQRANTSQTAPTNNRSGYGSAFQAAGVTSQDGAPINGHTLIPRSGEQE